MQGISADMTVREALRLLSPAHQINLQHWAAESDLPLREFHLAHIRTYESERLRTESRHTINAEVSTLLDLLASAGVGDEIRRLSYHSESQRSFLQRREPRCPSGYSITLRNSRVSLRTSRPGTIELRTGCARPTGRDGRADEARAPQVG